MGDKQRYASVGRTVERRCSSALFTTTAGLSPSVWRRWLLIRHTLQFGATTSPLN
jgi:hypothetical protein